MRVTRAAAALLAAAALAGCSPSGTTGQGGPDELVVLGAASTRVLNEDIQRLSPDALTFVNAGSSDLVQQLRDGSPGDLLITADQKTMDAAVADGVADNPRVVATNSMVLVVPRGNPAGITRVEDVQREGVHLVTCDAQVPCGAVTGQLAEANGLALAPVSLEHNVADTLGKVVSGEADAGFVYRTDAAAAGDAVEVIEIPHAEEYPNSLVAAVTTGTQHRDEAGRLLETLSGEEMAQAWSRHGFTPAG